MCVASSIRAMPENEIPPAMRVDIYYPKIYFSAKEIFIFSFTNGTLTYYEKVYIIDKESILVL